MKSTGTSTVKKHLSWTKLLVLLVITHMHLARANVDTTISVEPDASMAEIGESFTINVNITGVQNLYGVEVTLQWNASILEILDIDLRLGVESHPDGVLHEPIFIAKNGTVEEGRYLLAGTSTVPAASFNGSGNIARITFNVIDFGSCKLDLETELRGKPPPGEVAPEILHAAIDGFFGRQISIVALPVKIAVGEEVDVNGFVIPARPDCEVTILYRREGEENWRTLTTIRTNDQGSYHYDWRVEERGEYEVRATAVIEGREETSSSIHFIAETPAQSMIVYIIVTVAVMLLAGALLVAYFRKAPKR